ncbi:MAG: UTP--glucose-1-phosphate uridylyltransferase [Nitrospirota bacterium]|nr:UTP--glucose-1-phosphate uridylyltransferase [Nitrospirota bacterium]
MPATKALPKEMLPVVDKPLIEYAVDEARSAGIEEFIFVTGRGKTAIEDHFDNHYELEQTLSERGRIEELDQVNRSKLEPGQAAYVRQMSPLGLGHAVWCARNLVNDEPFAVLLADDLIQADKPTLGEMVEVYEQHGGNVVSLMEVPLEQTTRYGIVEPGHTDGNLVEIRGLVEKPDPSDAPSNLAIVGRYILQPEIMDHLAQGKSGTGNEIQLTDSMMKMVGSSPFHGLRLSGKRFDCGTKAGFLAAGVALALNRKDIGSQVRASLTRLLEEG